MFGKIGVTFLLNLTLVLCQDCVTFNFEDGFEEYFDNDRLVCSNFPLWNVGYYADIIIEPPNNLSATFVYPNPSMSCASSFEFEMDTTGVLEVNVIVESNSLVDQLVVLVQGVNPGANDVVIGQGTYVSMGNNPLSTGGVIDTITIAWTVTGTYNAYVAFMGLASEDSIFLIDSMRYIPPTVAEEECLIYEPNTTELPTTEEPTTEEPTTEEPTTEEPTTEPPTTEPPTTEPPTTEPPTTEPPTTEPPTTEPPTELPTTESPTTEPGVGSTSFWAWNYITISTVSVLCLIVLCLISWFFYECGRRKALKDIDPVVDIDNLPNPFMVPRVTKVYYDGSLNSRIYL